MWVGAFYGSNKRYKGGCKVESQSGVIILMPKKHSRRVQYHKDSKKRRMRRMMQDRLKRLSLSQLTFRTCLSSSSEIDPSNTALLDLPTRRKVILRKEPSNFIQALQYPVQTNCIFTLYGMITIDENALKNEVKDQSLIKALFNFYSLSEVQINPDYLLLKIHKSKENYFPISYIVERFKSYGDSFFYEMANKIDEIRAIFDQMHAIPSPPLFNDKQIEKFIDAVRGKRAMLRISPNCLIFTNQLLKIGDYSIADVGTQCLSYRSFVSDVFLADDYRGQITKFFQLYELNKKLRKGEMSQQEYMSLAKQREIEYIITKKNSMMKVMTSKYNLAPGVGCWEIQQILDEKSNSNCTNREIEGRKRRFVEESISRELKTLLKLTKVPQNLKKLNEGLVCSYRSIEVQN